MVNMNLTRKHKQILIALAEGRILKTHRDINGKKTVRLHSLDDHDDFEVIPRAAIDLLKEHGLIDSNKKFPAATYFLTEYGKDVTQSLTGEEVKTVGPVGYIKKLFKGHQF